MHLTGLKEAIEQAKVSNEVSIFHGGNCDDSKGYFVEPTVLITTNPQYDTMTRELFGPVATVYIYEDKNFEDILKLVDQTSDYALNRSNLLKRPLCRRACTRSP